jgi:hypothetical protein
MDNGTSTAVKTPAAAKAETILELQGFSYEDRQGLLPLLTSAFARCGGWVLERKTISATAMEFRFELQLQGIVELYAALIATGVELTRNTHAVLTDLCTCRHHLGKADRLGKGARAGGGGGQILTIRLELNFLEDLTLHSLLNTGGLYA